MRAISLWQPWASALMLGEHWKQHETRHWKTDYVGRVAIHAAKRYTRGQVVCLMQLVRAQFPLSVDGMPLGCILGTARLVGCYPTETSVPSARDFLAGNWEPGRFAWRFEDPVVFREPLPYRGAQGWFQVDEALLLRESR